MATMYASGVGFDSRRALANSCAPAPAPARRRRIAAAAANSSRPASRASDFPVSIPNPIEDAINSGKAAATALCDTVESFISAYIDPRELPPSLDPKVQLADNFAPVGEFPPQPCRVSGTIPQCLRGGAYIRNGSNPLHPPPAGYHYFDGHGMLHSVKFADEEDGAPIYCARFTRTNRFLQEQAAGKPLFPYALGTMSNYAGLARFGLFAMRTALGLIDVMGGMGTSNAGMGYFDRRILAMSEEDLPYAVRITEKGDLVTMGRYSFHKKLLLPMCAHPKRDPVTGELFAFSFNPVVNPHIRYFWATPDGKKSADFDVWLRDPCLFHDFAITENYAILPENQIVMKLQDLVLANRNPIKGDSSKTPGFAVIPRIPTADSRPQWIDVPDWSSFHYYNAWEEGNREIVVLSSSISPVECLFDDVAALASRLTEIHLDLRSGRSYKQHVCSAGLDFGHVNQRFLGRKNRYVYLCYYGPWPKFGGLAKVDLQAPRLPRMIDGADPDLQEPCVASSRRFEPGRFCSEPFFVPRSEDSVEEDDGYVLSYVYDERNGDSELLVMDAKSPNLATVAAIELPARVPYGFHGIFVNADQVADQSHVILQ